MLDLFINFKNTITTLIRSLEKSTENAQNLNVSGYKNQTVTFEQTYIEATSGTVDQNPQSPGSGITIAGYRIDFTQGALTAGTPLDAAIDGEGFFLLSPSTDPSSVTSANAVLTRSGQFMTDSNYRYLKDANGNFVYGYRLNPTTGKPINSELVPIETNGEVDIGFENGGILASNFQAAKSDDGITSTPMYQLALTSVTNKQGLIKTGAMFRPSPSSGNLLAIGVSDAAISTDALSGTYGSVKGEMLEGSNFDIAKIALDMNQLQRSLTATQGALDNVGKVLTNLMSKILG
jgi:flagellar hook protein FlgE